MIYVYVSMYLYICIYYYYYYCYYYCFYYRYYYMNNVPKTCDRLGLAFFHTHCLTCRCRQVCENDPWRLWDDFEPPKRWLWIKTYWSTRFWGMNWMSPHFPRPSHFPSYFGVSSSATCLTHTQMRDNLAGRGSQFQVGTERKNPSWRPRFPSQLVTSEGISAYVTLPSICAFNHLGLVIQHHPTMEDSKHGMSWHLSKEV